jgi:hypothetical protein
MIGLLCFVLAVLASLFKSKLRLEAENAACLSEIKFGYIGGEVRRGMASAQCDQRHE